MTKSPNNNILKSIQILPEDLVNKIFFYVDAPHPLCKLFREYCTSLQIDWREPCADWPPLYADSTHPFAVRSYYRDKTYFQFNNAYRREQIKRRHRRPRIKNRSDQVVNSTLASRKSK
jgi:hypothetical protein